MDNEKEYIDKDEAKRILIALPADLDAETVQRCIEAIDRVPAAEVELVRHGRWVGMREYCQHLYDTTGERYTMSQLGISLPHCNQCWAENESRKPFCPNCGAKMGKEEENA